MSYKICSTLVVQGNIEISDASDQEVGVQSE